jgi:hypothetical protein
MKSSGCGSFSGSTKIRGSATTQQKRGYDRKEQSMHGEFKHRMKGAQDNVVRNPGEEDPTRPVAAAQQEYATDDRQKANQENRDSFSHTRGPEFGGVICQSDRACQDEKPGNQGDGERSFAGLFDHVRRCLGFANIGQALFSQKNVRWCPLVSAGVHSCHIPPPPSPISKKTGCIIAP